jgi:hypothetical protein
MEVMVLLIRGSQMVQIVITGPPGINGGGTGPNGGIYPYDEYKTLPIHRILTYSQPVESYTWRFQRYSSLRLSLATMCNASSSITYS